MLLYELEELEDNILETLIFEDIQDSYSAAKKPLISTKKKYTS